MTGTRMEDKQGGVGDGGDDEGGGIDDHGGAREPHYFHPKRDRWDGVADTGCTGLEEKKIGRGGIASANWG